LIITEGINNKFSLEISEEISKDKYFRFGYIIEEVSKEKKKTRFEMKNYFPNNYLLFFKRFSTFISSSTFSQLDNGYNWHVFHLSWSSTLFY
jgi:hypothetical protein